MGLNETLNLATTMFHSYDDEVRDREADNLERESLI
jgi:hypothetical protein